MKTAVATIALLISLLFCGSSAFASTFTAGDLQESCPASFGDVAKLKPSNVLCIGYIAGWLDGINGSMVKTDDGKLVMFQLAPKVTTKQVIAVFLKYMEAHPEVQNKDGEDILIAALTEVRLIKFAPVVEESQVH
jgi:hypothetical protein